MKHKTSDANSFQLSCQGQARTRPGEEHFVTKK